MYGDTSPYSFLTTFRSISIVPLFKSCTVFCHGNVFTFVCLLKCARIINPLLFPAHVCCNPSLYTAPLLEDEGELKMAFKVMTKKGNKQQVGDL